MSFVIGRGRYARETYPEPGGGGSAAEAGEVKAIRFLIVSAPVVQMSATPLPAGAVIVETVLSIETPFSAGATITIGDGGNPARFQPAADNTPQVLGDYSVNAPVVTPASGVVLATIGGAPVVGSGHVLVLYVQPLP